MKRGAIIILCAAYAGVAMGGAGFYSGEFAGIPVHPRIESRGGAGVAHADDIDGADYNPASIGRWKGIRVAYSHYFLVEKISFEHFAFGLPLPAGNFLVETTVMHTPELSGGSAASGDTGVGGATFTLGYGLEIPGVRELRVGVVARGLYEKVGVGKSGTVAFDLGGTYDFNIPGRKIGIDGKNFSIGLAIQNLGAGYKGRPLQRPFSIGARYEIGFNQAVREAFFLDAYIPNGEKSEIKIGTEIRFVSHAFLRFGYGLGREARGFTVGAGGTFRGFSLDYGFIPMGEIGMTHIVGVRFALDGLRARRVAPAPRKNTTGPAPLPELDGVTPSDVAPATEKKNDKPAKKAPKKTRETPTAPPVPELDSK